MFDVVLVTFNYTMAHDNGILVRSSARQRAAIGVIAMKTQAGGSVRPDSHLPKPLPPVSQTALLKWVLNHDFVTTAIPGFSTYEHLEQDFSVAGNLAYSEDEKTFLADKSFTAQAEFCQQCGECREACPKQVEVPALMRSHMYALQIRQYRYGADHACRNSSGQRIGNLQKLRSVQRGVPKLRASRPENWRTQGVNARTAFSA